MNHSSLASPFQFTSIAKESGIDFIYYGNPSPQHYMVEQNGGGVAFFDFDCDGRLDIFFANGSHFDHPAEQAEEFHQLYRSAGLSSKKLDFDKVTAPAGLKKTGFGMGIACGDYDNDGFVDLYLCAYGKNSFWQNNGDGTFSDVTDQTKTGDEHWGTSAAFADLDGDGNLDLYVTNYVEYSRNDPPCYTTLNSQRLKISCGPIGRIAQPDVLYKNLGDGTFSDESAQSGITQPAAGKGLAVQIVDLDNDGLLDIFVANDTTDNFFFRNSGELHFEEQGLIQGVAVGDNGLPQSSMGIACADFNKNGHFDLFITNFENSPNDFYEQIEPGIFLASNSRLGLDTASRPMLAFGTVAADFNLDQWPDLFIANGHIWDLNRQKTEHEYEMTQQLYLNQSGTRFVDVSSNSGSYFKEKFLGRAVAVGDVDNDGDSDLVTSHEIKPAALLRNDSSRAGKSLRIKLIGVKEARQPLGITIKVFIDKDKQIFNVPAGGSFQSSNDPRVLVPIDKATSIDRITVSWPSGQNEHWKNIPVREELILVEGTAK
ncbi:CRTAC1 family protein [Gimesia aquarii]|uniref:CRTAC1 family protein n=1 Tax=Gimesia aquarii TaxID=2527964 RepID=UPI0018D98343|nr:CRTAC1 family protein [Gimesia aquarii]